MRVNPRAPTAAFLPTGKDKNPVRYVRGGKVINPRLPGQALPPQISWRDLPVYKPEPSVSVRAGADDHLKYRSIR